MKFCSARLKSVLGAAAAAATLAGFSLPAAAETRSFVIGWFIEDAYATTPEADCPKGLNKNVQFTYPIYLKELGKTDKEVEAMMEDWVNGGPLRGEVGEMMAMRGRLNGQPVNAYANPQTVKDPMLHWGEGKMAYGFNLDGLGADSPNSFTNPETGEKGVNNQLWRAFTCKEGFRGTRKARAAGWEWLWTQLRASQPAWLITIEGDDLSKDGPVTVTFDRALEAVRARVDETARHNATYRIDPDPRSHNVYKAQLKDGVVWVDDPSNKELHLIWNPLAMPELHMHHVKMRLQLNKDGTLEGTIGGYQPWTPIYFMLVTQGQGGETDIVGDFPGSFYLLKKLADADPDPVTGQNMSISSAFRIEAVPAFAVSVENDLARGAAASAPAGGAR